MPRIINVVEDTWGKSMIFKPEISEVIINEPSIVEPSIEEAENETSSSESEHSVTAAAYTKLSYMHSSLFATILEDTITQLRILVECNNELRIIKTKTSDWTYLLCMKYAVKQPTSVDELEGLDPRQYGCNEYKINKLDADRKYVIDVIIATYVDLCVNGSFIALGDAVKAIVDRDNYRISLAEDEAKNKMLRHELNRQLRQQRNHNKSVIYDSDVKIDELKTKVEDSVLNSECCSRYTDNWERARTEQHVQTIRVKENVYLETVEYFKQRTDHEQRVHQEIEVLISIAINETLQKVEEWMNKYEKDMEAIDLKIQIKKNDYKDMLDKRVNLEETIEKHDKLMKDWIYFKEEREKARLYCEKMTSSAIIVQAWWRGLLVRRQLGPYKVPKKPKGKKK